MIAPDSRYIQEIDDMLTLDGLRILFERNRGVRPRGRPQDNKTAAGPGESTRSHGSVAGANVGERQP
jgi:hypothetical protein